eukprot:CAMPEP_0185697444 /NCGR_PEP_ID=MMETSP1164-20130828/5748_1 /TAXON_ID=1104430 /ORGANISM="Chrysoreinhardia sp, Strain CCMP2950" /LENGTH=369 /DNA_ID=CAMNT_0028364341 /DNA_START=162 /DNA_END=1270 /DNA_ORIENTATION=+
MNGGVEAAQVDEDEDEQAETNDDDGDMHSAPSELQARQPWCVCGWCMGQLLRMSHRTRARSSRSRTESRRASRSRKVTTGRLGGGASAAAPAAVGSAAAGAPASVVGPASVIASSETLAQLDDSADIWSSESSSCSDSVTGAMIGPRDGMPPPKKVDTSCVEEDVAAAAAALDDDDDDHRGAMRRCACCFEAAQAEDDQRASTPKASQAAMAAEFVAVVRGGVRLGVGAELEEAREVVARVGRVAAQLGDGAARLAQLRLEDPRRHARPHVCRERRELGARRDARLERRVAVHVEAERLRRTGKRGRRGDDAALGHIARRRAAVDDGWGVTRPRGVLDGGRGARCHRGGALRMFSSWVCGPSRTEVQWR